MSSSSLPLTFNSLHSWQQHSKTPELKFNVFSFPKFTSFSLSKSHICFTYNANSSEHDWEETRWLREEQRWLREEQRWLREEQRWQYEREALLNEIKNLKLHIESLRREGRSGSEDKVVNYLMNVLKKEVSQISESGSSVSPFVFEADAKAVEDVKEVEVVKEVVKEEVVEVREVKVIEVKDSKKKMTMLRAGAEGDQVQMLQEALLKLGFYCGEEDEEFSSYASGTERAVKTWQSSIGVPETGVMTVELLERLYMDSGFKEVVNGAVATSVTGVPEIPVKTVIEDPKAYVSDDRVFLLGENRYEDSSRLQNQNSLSQTSSKGVVTTKCITCRGEGQLLCLECDGTGEPNIEPQFLEWVGEDTKCPYCEGRGHTDCDACQGTGFGVV